MAVFDFSAGPPAWRSLRVRRQGIYMGIFSWILWDKPPNIGIERDSTHEHLGNNFAAFVLFYHWVSLQQPPKKGRILLLYLFWNDKGFWIVLSISAGALLKTFLSCNKRGLSSWQKKGVDDNEWWCWFTHPIHNVLIIAEQYAGANGFISTIHNLQLPYVLISHHILYILPIRLASLWYIIQ